MKKPISLKKTSGLPISFSDGNLIHTKEVAFEPVQARKIEELRGYLKDKNSPSKISAVYLMFRDIRRTKDERIFRKNRLRYDITAIFPYLFGKEFSKTIGHNHQPIKGMEAPEIYEVLSGKALFIFQNIKKKEVYLIEAKQGEKVIVPPDCGHATVNPTGKVLIIANIFADNIKSDYKFFKQRKGAAIYALKEKTGIFIEKNPSYKEKINVKIGSSKKLESFNISNKPMYELFAKNPEKFEFLTNPDKYKQKLKPENLFQF